MFRVRRSEERGRTQFGWLDSRHTFSFGNYLDPEHMGYRSLRVINDDWIDAGQGFGMHGHRDMEIVTWVLSGAVAHKDSLGNGSTIRPGDIQRMTAGSGIRHSEFNPSSTERLHLLQIWILPAQRGTQPGYAQETIPPEARRDRLALAAGPAGTGAAVTIGQDTRMFVGSLSAGRSVTQEIAPGHGVWIHVAGGSATVNGQILHDGDGAAIEDESALTIDADRSKGAEIVLFDTV